MSEDGKKSQTTFFWWRCDSRNCDCESCQIMRRELTNETTLNWSIRSCVVRCGTPKFVHLRTESISVYSHGMNTFFDSTPIVNKILPKNSIGVDEQLHKAYVQGTTWYGKSNSFWSPNTSYSDSNWRKSLKWMTKIYWYEMQREARLPIFIVVLSLDMVWKRNSMASSWQGPIKY